MRRETWRTVGALSLYGLLFVGCGTGTPQSNLVSNGDFALWSRGPSNDPDGWARIADVGRVERAEPARQAEGHAARYTRVDGNVNAFNDLLGYESLKAVTCSAWVLADRTQVTRLVVDDGLTVSYSSWNETAGGPERITVSHTTSPGATHLRVVLDVSGASPRLTVPGTTASFEDVRCEPSTPSLLSQLKRWDSAYQLADRALELLIALAAALGAVAWYHVRHQA